MSSNADYNINRHLAKVLFEKLELGNWSQEDGEIISEIEEILDVATFEWNNKIENENNKTTLGDVIKKG